MSLSVSYLPSSGVISVLSVNYHPVDGVISVLSINYHPSNAYGLINDLCVNYHPPGRVINVLSIRSLKNWKYAYSFKNNYFLLGPSMYRVTLLRWEHRYPRYKIYPIWRFWKMDGHQNWIVNVDRLNPRSVWMLTPLVTLYCPWKAESSDIDYLFFWKNFRHLNKSKCAQPYWWTRTQLTDNLSKLETFCWNWEGFVIFLNRSARHEQN